MAQEKKSGLKVDGAPTLEELRASPGYVFPGEDRARPAVVIECIEGIPCDPCETSCPFGAITVGEEITNLPVVDLEKCTGCGICVAACPGLAIYLKQRTYGNGESLIAFPFEYLPLPEAGQAVEMVDRFGETVCPGRIVKVVLSKKNDRTAVVYAAYPGEFFENVVSIARPAVNRGAGRSSGNL